VTYRSPILSFSICGVILLAAGCQQPKNTISQVDPYVGQRPPPVAQLPDRDLTPEPKPQRPKNVGASAGWIPPGGISSKWECIVIHHSESDKSTPEGMRDWHVRGRGWDELGYHFVIGNGIGYGDGKVYVGARWTKQMHGAHCKTPNNYYNDHGIGICLIGNFEDHPPTSKQMQTLSKLVNFLSGKCGIPSSKVNTHGGITHKTACPGKRFNLQSLMRQLSSASLADGESVDPLRSEPEP
jgi:N-acetylmuramoyl-L-alanine amidase